MTAGCELGWIYGELMVLDWTHPRADEVEVDCDGVSDHLRSIASSVIRGVLSLDRRLSSIVGSRHHLALQCCSLIEISSECQRLRPALGCTFTFDLFARDLLHISPRHLVGVGPDVQWLNQPFLHLQHRQKSERIRPSTPHSDHTRKRNKRRTIEPDSAMPAPSARKPPPTPSKMARSMSPLSSKRASTRSPLCNRAFSGVGTRTIAEPFSRFRRSSEGGRRVIMRRRCRRG